MKPRSSRDFTRRQVGDTESPIFSASSCMPSRASSWRARRILRSKASSCSASEGIFDLEIGVLRKENVHRLEFQGNSGNNCPAVRHIVATWGLRPRAGMDARALDWSYRLEDRYGRSDGCVFISGT